MKKLRSRLQNSLPYLFVILISILHFYLMEWYTHNPFQTMKFNVHIMNIVLFSCIGLFLYALTGNVRTALVIETLFCCIYGLAGYFVLEFRGAPIQPWDILSLDTAASVADNYEYKLDRNAAIVLICFLLLLAGELLLPLLLRKKKIAFGRIRRVRTRILLGALSFLLIFGYTKMLHNEVIVQQKLRLYDKLFTPTTIQYKNGTLTAFLMELQYMSVDKPDGYSEKKAQEILNSYASDPADSDRKPFGSADSSPSADTEKNSRPNIIVIMNEAFSDPAVLGDFTTNEDYMPFVHSLLAGADDTISGSLSVSVKGGNTANTEFEYLTGSTMAFLPYGSIPYQQYIKKETPSLASELASLGYRTVAMHPYRAAGWDRDRVYPDFGFQEMYFQEFYKNAEKVRKYVSDRADYEKIIEIYENKPANQPLFLFNVTMQNHSSYSDWADYDNFTPDITVKDSKSKLLPAYLSLMKLSDEAISGLISYFAAQEEETIIVFFGDHQPTDSIVNPVLALHGKSCKDLTEKEEALRYQVPFFIWANYDIAEKSNLALSPNFLAAKTLQTAKLPLPGYFQYLTELNRDVSVISASHMILSDGSFTEIKEQKELLSKYRMLQYYLLFDR